MDSVVEDFEKGLTGLNKSLRNAKYLVGEKLSIADIAIAATIGHAIATLYGENERKKITNIVKWY